MSKSGTSLPSNVQHVERTARNAETGRWMTVLARYGYAAKGLVYLIIGAIAAQVAFGARGAITDQKGELQMPADDVSNLLRRWSLQRPATDGNYSV